jgi:hypothetical protein
MPFGIEKQVLGLEITVGDTLLMQVLDAVQDLFEAAFDFAW